MYSSFCTAIIMEVIRKTICAANHLSFHLFSVSNVCATEIYVIMFTSGVKHAGSNDSPYISVRLHNGETKHLQLYDRPGDDMLPNKGDLWSININSFGFSNKCIVKKDISEVIIEAGGNDGVNIESIMTMLHGGQIFGEVLTANWHVNRWIDGDGINSRRKYRLTKV